MGKEIYLELKLKWFNWLWKIWGCDKPVKNARHSQQGKSNSANLRNRIGLPWRSRVPTVMSPIDVIVREHALTVQYEHTAWASRVTPARGAHVRTAVISTSYNYPANVAPERPRWSVFQGERNRDSHLTDWWVIPWSNEDNLGIFFCPKLLYKYMIM